MNHPTHTLQPSEYPYLLQQIQRQPPHLYMQGVLPPAHFVYLCVIGSRNHSTYGKEVCEHLIQGLAGYPIVIVSGLALGIDSLAHEAALAAQLPTIAFPGSGLASHVLYPSTRRDLARRIVNQGGALLSPFSMNHPGLHWTFPERNRLMAGISKATLIIEGRKGSGTLGTAEYASQFNREVMIVPGSIFSELSYGPLSLLKDGAHPVTSAKEILSVLGFDEPASTSQQPQSEQLPLWSLVEYSPLEKQIIERLVTPSIRDEVIRSLNVSLSQANATISELEIKGILAEENGMLRLVPKRR